MSNLNHNTKCFTWPEGTLRLKPFCSTKLGLLGCLCHIKKREKKEKSIINNQVNSTFFSAYNYRGTCWVLCLKPWLCWFHKGAGLYVVDNSKPTLNENILWTGVFHLPADGSRNLWYTLITGLLISADWLYQQTLQGQGPWIYFSML